MSWPLKISSDRISYAFNIWMAVSDPTMKIEGEYGNGMIQHASGKLDATHFVEL